MGVAGRDKALEDAFYQDGYLIAGKHVGSDCSQDAIIMGLSSLYSTLDAFIGMFLHKAAESEQQADCKKGCSWCCHQAVFAETHTLDYLLHQISLKLSPGQKQIVRQAAENKFSQSASLDLPARLTFKYPCPLLKDGSCMVYEGRPVSCRIYLSSDVSSCKYEYETPTDNSRYPSLFALPLQLGRKLNEGFAGKLLELGMEIREIPLEEGLLKHLS